MPCEAPLSCISQTKSDHSSQDLLPQELLLASFHSLSQESKAQGDVWLPIDMLAGGRGRSASVTVMPRSPDPVSTDISLGHAVAKGIEQYMSFSISMTYFRRRKEQG